MNINQSVYDLIEEVDIAINRRIIKESEDSNRDIREQAERIERIFGITFKGEHDE